MKVKVEFSKIWLYIALAGIFTMFLGLKSNQVGISFLGIYVLVGSLTCGTSGVVIKYFMSLKNNK